MIPRFLLSVISLTLAQGIACRESFVDLELYKWRTSCADLCDFYKGAGVWYCSTYTGVNDPTDDALTDCVRYFHPRQCVFASEQSTPEPTTPEPTTPESTTPESTTPEPTTHKPSTAMMSTLASTTLTETVSPSSAAITDVTEAVLTEVHTTEQMVVTSLGTTTKAKATQGRRTTPPVQKVSSSSDLDTQSTYMDFPSSFFSTVGLTSSVSEKLSTAFSTQHEASSSSAPALVIEDCRAFFEDKINSDACQAYCAIYAEPTVWCSAYHFDVFTLDGLLGCIYAYHAIVCQPGIAVHGH